MFSLFSLNNKYGFKQFLKYFPFHRLKLMNSSPWDKLESRASNQWKWQKYGTPITVWQTQYLIDQPRLNLFASLKFDSFNNLIYLRFSALKKNHECQHQGYVWEYQIFLFACLFFLSEKTTLSNKNEKSKWKQKHKMYFESFLMEIWVNLNLKCSNVRLSHRLPSRRKKQKKKIKTNDRITYIMTIFECTIITTSPITVTIHFK